ncbi:galactonate dehydratase [Alicyclobacillus cellulosilyticus]|uniref:Galactonate dehydratase n=1 Tax=Alicyclobacillus cellulosilyticus TaxID=1003997 RepID=A0A917NL13_9BACL|nr:galactonate dehydratase [Alicyclobacillus cellulosilyticus]GGJ08674.1 galactonate dehydratase [Alicyclobacillus cellulosilyticus]
MKIEKLECFKVPPRWLFLKVTTDDGLVGWGEPVVEGRADAVAAAVRELESLLVGQDPNRIEDLWQAMYRGGFYRGGPVLMSAIAGVDQALWDIKGKRYGLPVYEFLGGAVREKMLVYAWIGGDRPAEVGAAAKARQQEGFRAVKMNATEEMHYIDSFAKVEAVLARVAAVRDAVGKDFGIAVDFHGRVHKAMAKVLAKELDPFHLMFIEEPVLPEHSEALREVARHTATPIATGERMFSRWDFKRILQEGYVDIVQPDLSHAGGISEVRRIAAMAEAYDVAVAPHCPLGPIALAASLQVDFAAPNAVIQEQSLGIHYNQGNDLLDYVVDPSVFHFADGFVRRLCGPGLGIEIDEEKVREAAARGHDWKNPVWRLADGSIAEW